MSSTTNAAEAALVLIKNGAAPDPVDESGRSAAHVAAAHDSSEVLEEMLDAGADPNRGDGDGRRPIHYAVTACGCAERWCLSEEISACSCALSACSSCCPSCASRSLRFSSRFDMR